MKIVHHILPVNQSPVYRVRSPRHLRLNKERLCLCAVQCYIRSLTSFNSLVKMSTKENAEVAVDKVTENNEKTADAKAEVKGTKRPAEVSWPSSISECVYLS